MHQVLARRAALPLLSAGLLAFAGCSGGGGGGTQGAAGDTRDSSFARGALAYGGALPAASCDEGASLEGGRSYRVETVSRVDGAPIVFQLFEPAEIDCADGNPLILEGHGYSGSRQTEAEGGALALSASIAELTEAGYSVISIDQRGHGESGGTVRVMDPDFEGEDLIAIVDWAEQHLDWLARDGSGNLTLGSMGSSYGGGYQFLLWAVDPDRRLDAMVPEITWHDLDFSLNPGRVPKSYWGLVLSGAGDANTGFSQDPFIRSTLVEAGATGNFPEAARRFFNYHSPSYFCDNPLGTQVADSGDTSGFTLDPITGLLPITADGGFVVGKPPFSGAPPRVDALIFQGVRDDLFNLNEAYANYQCLQRGGGDVRLLSYPFGHHFLSPNAGLLIEGALSQSVPLDRACGPIDASAAAVAWFDEKLRGIGDADEVITTGRDVCLSLTQDDAIAVPEMPVGGEAFDIALPGDAPVTVLGGVAGVAPTIVPLTTIEEGTDAVAGIPTAEITVSRGSEALDEACLDERVDPILGLGSCDSIVFVGLGIIRAGMPVPDLLEEQVLPIRGLGTHEVDLIGVAERVAPGDQLVLLLYGFQDGFALSFSRDLSVPLVTVSGEVRVPLVSAPTVGGND